MYVYMQMQSGFLSISNKNNIYYVKIIVKC